MKVSMVSTPQPQRNAVVDPSCSPIGDDSNKPNGRLAFVVKSSHADLLPYRTEIQL